MKSFSKIFSWLLLAPALVPFVFVDGLIYPYMTTKTLLLRGIGILAAAVFCYLALVGEPLFWDRLKNKLSLLPAALLIVAYATSLFGIDFYRSFWSTYSRGDGLLSLTILVFFFYAILLYADAAFVSRLYKVVAWVATAVAVQALFEWFSQVSGIAIPFIPVVAGRIEGTLGNPAFLASYLTLTFFVTFFVARSYRGGWRTTLYISAVLQVFAVLLTATRGSMLALGGAFVLFLIYRAWAGEAGKRTYARYALGALVILIILFVALRGPLSRSGIGPLERVASISLSDPTVSSRLFLWSNLSRVALERPLTGFGMEHVDALFDKVYDPSQIDEQWFDRSHNSFLDYQLQFGILGLLLYLGMVGGLAYRGWRMFKGGDERGAYLFFIAFVYAVQDFFVFDTGVILWTLLALFALSFVPPEVKGKAKEVATPLTRSSAWQWVGGLLALVLLATLWPVDIQPLRANIDLFNGYDNEVSSVQTSVASMTAGYALNTYGNLEYGYQVFDMYTGTQLTKLQSADLVAAYQYAESVLSSDFARFPYDARTALYLAQVLSNAPSGAQVDTALLNQALERTTALSPKRAQAWYIRANILIANGNAAASAADKSKDFAAASSLLEQYVALVPKLAEPRYVLATIYLTLGDKASAATWAAQGLALYRGDAMSAERGAQYYIATEDWPHAEQFLSDVVAAAPTDYASTYDLAKVSYLAGDIARAKALYQQLLTSDPSLVNSDPAFVKAVNQ